MSFLEGPHISALPPSLSSGGFITAESRSSKSWKLSDGRGGDSDATVESVCTEACPAAAVLAIAKNPLHFFARAGWRGHLLSAAFVSCQIFTALGLSATPPCSMECEGCFCYSSQTLDPRMKGTRDFSPLSSPVVAARAVFVATTTSYFSSTYYV